MITRPMRLMHRIKHNSNIYTNKPGNNIVFTRGIRHDYYRLQYQHSGVIIQSEPETCYHVFETRRIF